MAANVDSQDGGANSAIQVHALTPENSNHQITSLQFVFRMQLERCRISGQKKKSEVRPRGGTRIFSSCNIAFSRDFKMFRELFELVAKRWKVTEWAGHSFPKGRSASSCMPKTN